MKLSLRTWQANAHDADPPCCSRQKARCNALLRWCIIMLLAALLKSPPATSANDVVPPFLAEGHISTREFRTERTNLNYNTEANIFFLSSNGWWQIEVKYLNPKPGAPSLKNCMKIPDGTRSYTLFEGSRNKGITSAGAWPTAFPPPASIELLVSWLSLCPQPELPVIDGKRMRRFIDLPIWRPDVFNQPQNEGYYHVKHLQPGDPFLSELDITNNGFSVTLEVGASGDVDGKVTRLSSPFEGGFTEVRFQIIETTNLNGMKFPMRTIYERFSPNWGGKDRNDLRLGLLSELVVNRISFAEKDVTRRGSVPSELIAFDARPPNLPKNITVDYLVKDDQWKPLSDPEIALGVLRATEAANRITERPQ